MRASVLVPGALVAIGVSFAGGAPRVREIGFTERVAAERAIEKVYYGHQIGATRSFDEAVSRGALESSVRRYLGQSAALRDFWNTPIDGQALRNEMNRIARGTRFPERLREVYGALGDDPFVVQECLARRTLADRWARTLFASDRRIHREARREAEALQRRLSEDPSRLESPDPRRRVVELSRSRPSTGSPASRPAAPEAVGDTIIRRDLDANRYERLRAAAPARVGEVGSVVEEPDRFVIRAVLAESPDSVRIALYVVAKKSWEDWWSAVGPEYESRALPAAALESVPLPAPATRRTFTPDDPASCLPSDSWDVGPGGEVPDGRGDARSVWTGSVMVVWGGNREGRRLDTGGRYDPVTDSWHPTSLVNAPSPRYAHTAVWTGTRMIVWGGSVLPSESIGSGGQYDPVADRWTPTETIGAPSGRQGHTAVWTGHEMVVWGGTTNDPNGNPIFLNDGGRYDPATNTWRGTSTVGAPEGRDQHTAVWAGHRMIVWGGTASVVSGDEYFNSGGRYDPVSDAWQPTSLVGAPEQRIGHTAVWTDHTMVVWGGTHPGTYPDPGTYPVAGGRYDPESDVWTPTSTQAAPAGRSNHTAVWTGSLMIVWGGGGPGGSYDPLADSWTAVSTLGAPSDRSTHVAVWTGTSMIVWGGYSAGALYPSAGGRYDPWLDRWTPTLSPNAPTPREYPTGVWTGNRMIVWGGLRLDEPLNTGGLYDPVTDSWTPTTTNGTASWRAFHTAVWTGDRMIVWGGVCTGGGDTGGIYDPVSDSWQPMSLVNAPIDRDHHTAVWTGSRMIVWGGHSCETATSVSSTGGSYDPATNTWRPLPTTKAPAPRQDHTAVWTGSRMLVWGGSDLDPRPTYFDSGGQFDPATNTWSTITKGGAPSPRAGHTAVWTGQEMIVWGGTGSTDFDTGGRYDPVSDRWRATSTTLAPTPRIDHAAVWSGSRMVVWGGDPSAPGGDALQTGGRYDPIADTWSPTSPTDAPAARTHHVAVWTGDFMLVWGGVGAYTFDSLGRYVVDNPDGDGDGVADVCDCSPSDPGVYRAPDEVEGLMLDADRTTLRWASAASQAGSATRYDLLRGGVGEWPIGSGSSETCLAPSISAATAQDPATPSSAAGFWYLVRARNACGVGTYGRSSNGAERISSTCP